METVKCYCNLVAEVKTSHTQTNPSRKFYKCSNQKCEFWYWVDQYQSQHIGTLSPATSQGSAPPTTPHRPMKRTASEFSNLSSSQKRLKTIEAALGDSGFSDHPGAISFPNASNTTTIGGTPSREKDIDDAPASPLNTRYNDVGARLHADGVGFPQTPRPAIKPVICLPSPSPESFNFELGSQQSSTTGSAAQDVKQAYSLGLDELTPELIGNMVNGLGNIPAYIRKLDRKLIAAEKSCDAKNKRIEYLEDEVKRLKNRQEELELIIAGYKAKGFFLIS